MGEVERLLHWSRFNSCRACNSTFSCNCVWNIVLASLHPKRVCYVFRATKSVPLTPTAIKRTKSADNSVIILEHFALGFH